DTMRALLKALRDWVSSDKEPPPSRYPTLAQGDLVPPTARAMGWPAIPGAPTPEGKLNSFLDYDFGPDFHYVDVSGAITRQPPAVRELPSRVPRVNADGNETAGIPSVQLQVPIGTYTGWNVRRAGYGAGGGCGFIGGFIPFAKTRAARLASRDPRPSLEERYADHAGFVARVRTAAAAQLRNGWLLPEDADRIVDQAENSDVLR
uniref:alpha/beta hydrolase domain-containing protein n=1 Tax=Sphingomonas sp. TaxID=28214 RepID=UPI003B3B5E2C